MRATLNAKELRVEVRDDGGPWIWPAQPDEHGRGLLIVASLARAWGRAGDSERGWTVWFEMDAGDYGGVVSSLFPRAAFW